MEWYVAIGSAIAVFVLSGAFAMIQFYLASKRNEQAGKDDELVTMRKFGFTHEEFQSFGYNHPKYDEVMDYFFDSASSVHFKNRLSDFMGFMWQCFSWFCASIVVILAIATVWVMINDKTWEPLVYWWGYLIFQVIFTALFWLWSKLCYLITGTCPGGAKLTRANLTKYAEKQEAMRRQQAGMRKYDDEDDELDYLPSNA